MILEPIEVKDKLGRTITIRSANKSDASGLVKYMKKTATETPFLTREPDEFCMTVEQEEEFIIDIINNPKELMLVAILEGEHIGNCFLATYGTQRRFAHRCSIAIALYQKYCGAGIGKLMLNTILNEAKQVGYEQAELEVVSTNENALNLYKSLGFSEHGTLINNMKYADGTYVDCLWMMKKL